MAERAVTVALRHSRAAGDGEPYVVLVVHIPGQARPLVKIELTATQFLGLMGSKVIEAVADLPVRKGSA